MNQPHPARARPGHSELQDRPWMTSGDIEIRVRGTLPAGAAERLGMRASVVPADTVLRGVLADGSALHGVLNRLRCNGIELIDVRRLPDPGVDA